MDIEQIATTAAATGLGGVSVGWLSKFLIKNYLNENSKKHDETDEKIDDLRDLVGEVSRKLDVTSALFSEFRLIENVVKTDHDELISHRSNIEKLQKDVSAAFQMKRDMKKQVDDLAEKIEELKDIIFQVKIDSVELKGRD